jgi:hypothetical protein
VCQDVYDTPIVLIYFIASTLWSAAAYGLLHHGGSRNLSVGASLVLPATLLAFLRPFPLPYAWAAPPEYMGRYYAVVSIGMVAAIAFYHGWSLRQYWQADQWQR